VKAEHSIGPSACRRHRDDGETGSIGGKDCFGLRDSVELGPETVLHGEIFDDSLDEEIRVGELIQIRYKAKLLQRSVALGLGRLAALDPFGEGFLYRLPRFCAERLGHLADGGGESGGGRDLRDSASHESAAEDGDFFYFFHLVAWPLSG